jgi:GxxExxY protein
MGMSEDAMFALCDRVRETAFSLHKFLRHGHLEKVYENGMLHRLRKQGLRVEPQFPLAVVDEDGTPLGEYKADLMVEGSLIVELKACRGIDDSHVAQLIGYLRGCRVEHGPLINFGAPRLQVKKICPLRPP